MSPLRRRKGRTSRARARRQELIQRERQAYGGKHPGQAPESPPGTPRPRPQGKPAARRAARARRTRQPRPRGIRGAWAGGGPSLGRARRAALRLGAALRRGLAWSVAWLLRLAGQIERGVIAVVTAIRRAGRRALELAERIATPERVLVVVTAAAAACLVASQFVTYRGVEVGQPQYAQVSTIAPPPQTDRVDAGAAHAYVLIPLAAIAAGLAIAALVTRRWRLGRLVALIGLLGIAVSLAIDLPKGLDAGTAGVAFAGARATLTEGFYAQLSACSVLALGGWLLGASLRPHTRASARRHRRRGRRARPSRAPSVAGGEA